jgi:hypothetical protein
MKTMATPYRLLQDRVSDAKYSCPDYDRESPISRRENNDCVVRSLASAFNIKYDTAHAYAKKEFGRTDGDGVRATFLKLEARKEMFGNKVEAIGVERPFGHGVKRPMNKRGGNITVGTMLKTYTTGTYIVIVRGHAFTIIDGIIFGNHADARRMRASVLFMFAVTPLKAKKKVVAVETGEKVCSCCGKKKAITEFNKNGSKSGDGRRARCKPCHKSWREARIIALKKV